MMLKLPVWAQTKAATGSASAAPKISFLFIVRLWCFPWDRESLIIYTHSREPFPVEGKLRRGGRRERAQRPCGCRIFGKSGKVRLSSGKERRSRRGDGFEKNLPGLRGVFVAVLLFGLAVSESDRRRSGTSV